MCGLVVVRVNGAITVVNAIASWKGAAVGIEMDVFARAKTSSDLSVSPEDPLVFEAVREALEFVRGKGVELEVTSSIPIGWGLKSSSAVANATVLAVVNAYGRRINLIDAIKLSVRAARRAGVTITGAMDDAAASMLGGLVVTDNSRDELLMRVPLPELDVAILLPSKESARPTSSVDSKRISKYFSLTNSLVELLPKRLWETMTLNGLLYSELLGFDAEYALKAIELGALGAGLSGTGPAVAAVCEDCRGVIEYWSSFGKVIRSRVTNGRAKQISSNA
ncbi:MAG: shikimate kinase [Candidatus Korarchaeum sp.]|nr:shikimate kinase [Candidatus Korarchaeum sp.]MDW8035077.1 shikimate kinase [Candidatus Korarchaeum sp.]